MHAIATPVTSTLAVDSTTYVNDDESPRFTCTTADAPHQSFARFMPHDGRSPWSNLSLHGVTSVLVEGDQIIVTIRSGEQVTIDIYRDAVAS